MNGREALLELERVVRNRLDATSWNQTNITIWDLCEVLHGSAPIAKERSRLSDIPDDVMQELGRLRAIEKCVMQLVAGAAHKDEPWDSPHNKALTNRGDTISVSEGDLWAVLPHLRQPPAPNFNTERDLKVSAR